MAGVAGLQSGAVPTQPWLLYEPDIPQIEHTFDILWLPANAFRIVESGEVGSHGAEQQHRVDRRNLESRDGLRQSLTWM